MYHIGLVVGTCMTISHMHGVTDPFFPMGSHTGTGTNQTMISKAVSSYNGITGTTGTTPNVIQATTESVKKICSAVFFFVFFGLS